MGADTKIQWADHTFNPWRGCQKIAPGCANCYAETQSKRNPATLGVWGPRGTRVVASETMWREPLKWDREAAKAGDRHRVFCASLADVFEDWRGEVRHANGQRLYWSHDALASPRWIPEQDCGGEEPVVTMDDVRARLFRTWRATPNLWWLMLTKRIENARRMLDGRHENLWLGVSIACRADLRLLDELRKCRDLCAKTFVSAEPLIEDLGEVDLTGVDWVIVGGESGPNARPCDIAWPRSLVRQCRAAGVPAFVKQLGEAAFEWVEIDDRPRPEARDRHFLELRDKTGADPAEWPEDIRVREVPT